MKNDNSRRDFLKKATILGITALASKSIFPSTSTTSSNPKNIINNGETGKFTLPALPYTFDALEPHIDKMTMEIHHEKHHQSYITNLNKALESLDVKILGPNPTLENIFENISKLPAIMRNNAGGHYNHSLFWTMMSAKGGGEPKGKLSEAINMSFGSFEVFKKQFSEVAMKRFGSGWAWLVKSKEQKLVICSTSNQDNPLMNTDEIETKGNCILALDVWEHAYYLKNQNKRADYITSWWNVVNWDTCEALFMSSK